MTKPASNELVVLQTGFCNLLMCKGIIVKKACSARG